MDISEATEKFEALFGEVLMGLSGQYSQTGEEYIEFGNDGARLKGEASTVMDFMTDKRIPGRTIHSTKISAVEQWFAQVMAIDARDAKTKTLYWRVKPETGFFHVDIHAVNGLFRVPTWAVYSRFLISDKPRKS